MTARPPAAAQGCTRRPLNVGEPAPAAALTVRCQIRLVGGEAGRALAAVQGRALLALLASLTDVEVGQGEEVSP
jgi:hypothetical protein